MDGVRYGSGVSDPSPSSEFGWRSRLQAELPLIIGLLLALGFLLHPAWFRFGYPHGADWDSYLASAAHLWLDPVAFRYNEWRQPLYPWLIGLLGGGGSYVGAGQALALLGSVGTVLGAGLLARALATPWAAGLAAVGTATLSVVVDGSWWVNPYPVVGGLTALSLAAAAWCCRWPRVFPALLAGALGGLCLALDPRGLPVALAAPVLVALGPGKPSRRGMLVGLVVLGLAGGWSMDRGLRAHYDLTLRAMGSQLALQHEQVRGPDAPVDGATVTEARACVGSQGQELGVGALVGECAQQRLRLNMSALRGQNHLPPAAPTLLLLALCALPAAWGRRSSAAAVLVFWPSAAALVAGMSWVPYVDRYLLPSAALLGCLGPVVLVRASSVVARRWPHRRALGWLGTASAAAWCSLVFPGLHPGDVLDPLQHIVRRKGELPAPVDARQVLADWAVATVGPDDLLLDCAELHLEILLLPQSISVWDAPPHDPQCRRRMKRPPTVAGSVWLLSLHRRGRNPDPRLVSPVWIDARGWEELPLELEIEPGTHAARRARWLRRWQWSR